MTIISRPWGGSTTGDSGPYSDSDWASLYAGLLSGIEDKRGVMISTEHAGFAVSEKSGGANMSVDVTAGEAIVSGRWVQSDAVSNVAIGAADPTLNRWDVVVLRTDATNQVATVAVVAGTAAASPSVPGIDTTGSPYFEIPLARVYVGAAVSSITDSVITDVRSAAHIPLRIYAEVTNKSGGELLPGEVVVWDNTNAQAVTTTTTQDNPMVAGVVADIIANNAEGRICIKGVMPVQVAAAVGIGNGLVTSTTAKKATIQGSSVFARALESSAGADIITALVNAKAVYPQDDQVILDLSSTSPTSTDTWEDITGATLTITTSGGDVEVSATLSVYQTSGSTHDCLSTFSIDGTPYAGGIGGGWFGAASLANNAAGMISFGPVRVSLAPGSHTFKLRWWGHTSMTSLPSTMTVFKVHEVID